MQHVNISRSPSPDTFYETNPLRDVRPEILSDLAHLDVSGRVRIKSAKVVSLGSYGEVLKGRYVTSDNAKLTVAIKRLRICRSEEITSLFEKEIYVWSKLKHPNILALVGYAFEPSGFPVFISEWMENGSVSSYVKRNPLCDILYLVHGIAEGLSYLHEEGVIHSDIKPENVLVSRYGSAVICDFGVSRMAVASRTLGQLTSTPKGTSRYMAYELLTSDSKNSKESDVWAFGMTVFELLAHQLPYAEYQRDVQVTWAITKGELPILPAACDVQSWPERRLLWDICQSCWELDSSTRATMNTIVTRVRRAVTLRLPLLHTGRQTDHQNQPAPPIYISIEDIPTLGDLYRDGNLVMPPDLRPRFSHVYAYLDFISVYQGDITKLEVDVIVYEVDRMTQGIDRIIDGSMDQYIHSMAGPEFAEASSGYVLDFGDAKMTSGCELLAKHVIHTRGPGPIHSSQDPVANASQLALCYSRSLQIAHQNSLKSIAFSPISTFEGEFPVEDAAQIALKETRHFLDMQRFAGSLGLKRIIFVFTDEKQREVYDRLIPSFFPAPSFVQTRSQGYFPDSSSILSRSTRRPWITS